MALATAAPWSPLAAQVRLPSLGDSASEDLDVATERRLGDQVMREIRRDPDYLDDPLLTEYVRTLFDALAAAARQRGEINADTDTRFAWEPFLVRDRVVNAFALPGGYIGIYLGLIALTDTPDELASVMAHELSHVTQRHIARSIGDSGRQTLISMAALILGVLAASRANSSDGVQAAVVGSQAMAAQGQLNFSRSVEREADRVGYDVMSTAGFSGAGMVGMFEKLDGANRLNDAGQFPYLRSHPLTVERISEARLRGTLAPPRVGASILPAGLDTSHALMRARARVWMNRSDVALRREQGLGEAPVMATLPTADAANDNARKARERLASLYASALASSMLRDFARADERLVQARSWAAQQMPDDRVAQRALILLEAETMVARGDVARAADAARALRGDMSRPALFMRAQAAALPRSLLVPGSSAEAAARESLQELQGWVSARPQDALAWSTLARVAQTQGLPLRQLRAEAESYAVQGDLQGAIDRFRAAQRAARSTPSADNVDVSIIDARLRDLEAQRRVQLRDSREGNL